MYDMLELEGELDWLPSPPSAGQPSLAGAAEPSWAAPTAGQPSRLPPPGGCASQLPNHDEQGDRKQGDRGQPCQPIGELLSMLSGCFELPLVDMVPQLDGTTAAVAAVQVPAAVAQAQMEPAQMVPPQQQPRQQCCRKRKGRKSLRKQTRHVPLLGLARSREAPGSRRPCGRKPAALPALLQRPCTRAAARAGSMDGVVGAAPAAAPQHPQLRGKAAQTLAAGLLQLLKHQLSGNRAEEVAARHRQQQQMLAEAYAQQQRLCELEQRAQLLKEEQAQRLRQLQAAAEQPSAQLLPADPPQIAAAARQRQLQRQPSWPEQEQLFSVPPVHQQRLPLLRTMSAPVERTEQRLAPPALLQRTLSLQLQQQEQRLARQRAEQQQWAEAAVRLVNRGGRL